ncbi:U11/U12 small nuclear ribonucleoprotein 35 kDa protein-like [Bacillus rossius redtenbacheri]|uniref:U11/U12 small nuclear ribonucleoprotein 35 kDa protein-like n=1 Tax=Bacillus rossius redtenbacheri TaxID=93214 RepID=UPI002FDEBFCE
MTMTARAVTTCASMPEWSGFAWRYDPLQAGSIDGTDSEPHDKAIIRALEATYIPNKNIEGNPANTIFVARLAKETTSSTIREVFSEYGSIRRCTIVRDLVTGYSKCYGFIEYEQTSSASKAYRKANRMVIDGKKVFVDFECERLLEGWKPRRLGGGFGGKKESGQLRFGGRDRPFKKPIAEEVEEGKLKRLNAERDRDRKRDRRWDLEEKLRSLEEQRKIQWGYRTWDRKRVWQGTNDGKPEELRDREEGVVGRNTGGKDKWVRRDH